MEIVKIEKSTNGHNVLVWKKGSKVFFDSPAIARAMSLELLMDTELMDHVKYLINKHYPEQFQDKALLPFEQERQRKIRSLVGSILLGNFSAAKWLSCHKTIATDPTIKRVGRDLKKQGKVKSDKIEKLDPKTQAFIKDVFNINGGKAKDIGE